MPTELKAIFTIADNGSVTLKDISTKTKEAQKNFKSAKKEADSFGNTAAGAAKKTAKENKKAANSVEDLKEEYQGATQAAGTLANTAAGAGSNSLRSWTADMMRFTAVGYTAKKAWDGAMKAINLSAMQKVQETTFQALLNHKEAGNALYDYVSAYAKISALGREEIANAVTAYTAYTKNADQLERLIKLTERLYAKDPSQGAEGAVFAMRELLSGDTMSIKDRFNMGGFSGETIRNFANTGDIEGLLDYVDQMFNRFGATQEVVDANYDNLITQTNIFASNMKTAIAESATPAMENLSGVMKRLNNDMSAGKFQPFIALMSNGMELIGSGVAWVADNLNWLAPAVFGVTTAFIIYKGVQMGATFALGIFQAVTALTTGNVIKLAGAVAGLVGGMAMMSKLSKDIDLQTDLDVSAAKEAFASFEKDLPGLQKDVPVHVSNSAPIKVKGEVEIEEESLRYMLDIQGQKWLAKFTTATLAPQNIFNGTVIRETADFEEFTQATIDSLKTATETIPNI